MAAGGDRRQAIVSGPLSRWLPVCPGLHAAPSVQTWICCCAHGRLPFVRATCHQV